MSVVDSRLGPGTLTLGTMTGAGCQMANVKLVPGMTEEAGTPTLCDPRPAPSVETTWGLEGSAVQDWEEDEGFVEFCRLNDGQTVPFAWVPNTGKAVTYSGDVQVRAVEFGGDVAKQNTTDFKFPVVGDLDRVKGTAPVSAGKAKPGGTFPAGTVVADLVASPGTAWQVGEGIAVGKSEHHWTGSAWAAGVA